MIGDGQDILPPPPKKVIKPQEDFLPPPPKKKEKISSSGSPKESEDGLLPTPKAEVEITYDPQTFPEGQIKKTPKQVEEAYADTYKLPSIKEFKESLLKSQTNIASSTRVAQKQFTPDSFDGFTNRNAELSEKNKKLVEQAIENTAKKKLAKTHIKDEEGKPLSLFQFARLNEEKQKLREQVATGEATFGMQDGEPGLKRTIGGWESLVNGWNEATESNDIAAEFADTDATGKLEILNRKAKENEHPEYIGERPNDLGSVTGLLGESAPFLGKAAAGAAVGTALTLLAPETGGLSTAGLPTAMSFLFTTRDAVNNGIMGEVTRRFQILKKDNPNMPDEDAMREAEKGALSGGTAGIATNALMMTPIGKTALSLEGRSVLQKAIAKTVASAVQMGATTAAVEGAKQAEGNLEGIETTGTDIAKSMSKTFVDNATVGGLLHIMLSAPKLPKVLKSAVKFALKDANPTEVATILKGNVEAGTIAPEAAENVMQEIKGYKEASDKVMPGLSPTVHASVTGLIEAKQKLVEESATKDKAVQEYYKEKIDEIDHRIKKIIETGRPYEYEIDEIAGDKYKAPEGISVQPPMNVPEAVTVDGNFKVPKGIEVQEPMKVPEPITIGKENIPNEEKATEIPNPTESESQSKEVVSEPAPETAGATKEGDEGIKIIHAETEQLRKEHSIEEYKKEEQKEENWIREADERIAKGDMPKLLEKMKRGDNISDVEQKMMGRHIATLDSVFKNDPSKENYNKLKEAVELSDSVGGSSAGRSLRARQGTFLPDDSLGKSMMEEEASLGVQDLSEHSRKEVIKEHEEITKIKDELTKVNDENARLKIELAAKENLDKLRKTSSGKSKMRDFKTERASLKDKLKQQFEEYKAAGSKMGISSDGGAESFVISAKMAKTVGEIFKSHAEETALKFEDLVSRVYDEVKDVLTGIKKSDIVDVMAGKYDERKQTINEAAARLRDLKNEAKLLKQLNDLRLGKEEKSEKIKNKKSRRAEELKAKIKEIRDRNKDTDEVEKTDQEKIAAKQKSILKKIEQIQADVKAGRFEKPEPKEPVILDKKTQLLQDRLLDLEAQQAVRRARNEYEKLSPSEKRWDKVWQALGLKRLVNAAIDFSIMFRQASPVTMNIMKYIPRLENGRLVKNTAPKAIARMFNLAFKPKEFKRFQYELEKSETGRLFTHFGGVFSNPTEVKMEKREEEFTNNLFQRIGQKIEAGDNETLKKAANVADTIWFSERAAAAILNTIRAEEFEKGVKILRKKGYTPENAPNQYKELVKWEMNKTGRGNMLAMIEDSHSGRLLANRTYFGARLMAAKINMLNPIYYARMPKGLRTKVLTDVLGNIGTMAIVALGARAAGASVSLDPDDSDFLQVRFGNKVYDISGGSAGYVRTFLRTERALVLTAKGVVTGDYKAANAYNGFAMRSLWKTMFANKLAPNTAYGYHFLTGKSGSYNEQGELEPFDPKEILKIYPLYVDGTIQAAKEAGVGSALSILLPDIFGIGTQQYPDGGQQSKAPKHAPKPPHPPKPKSYSSSY